MRSVHRCREGAFEVAFELRQASLCHGDQPWNVVFGGCILNWDSLRRDAVMQSHFTCTLLVDKIPPEMCANLVANYKKRLTSVIDNKGFATKH